MSISPFFKKTVYSAFVFFGTLLVLSIGYAAYTTMAPATSGQSLTATAWNTIIANIDDLNSRWARSGSNLAFTGGNIGIGTASPTDNLDIFDGTTTNADSRIRSRTTNVSASFSAAEGGNRYFGYSNGLEIMTHTNHPIGFGTNITAGSATPNMVILPSGNVGIGTTNPQGKLEVTNATNIARTIVGWPGNGGIWGTNSAGNLHLDADGTLVDGRIYLNWYSGKGVAVGNGAVGYGSITAANFINASDRRLKENIETIVDPLEKVEALRGVTFQWKSGQQKDIGFIAQEVEKVLPELIITDEHGLKGVRYSNVAAVLVEAIKELKKQNDALKNIVCKNNPEEEICK